jgi:N-methylhydantoinase A
VHAYEVARRLGIREIVCPPAAGVASALGFLVSPFSVDLVRTHPLRLGAADWPAVEQRLAELTAEAWELLARAGARVEDVRVERRVDMRYAGQGYEVPVALPDGPLGPELEPGLRAAFDEGYERRFGFRLESAATEALHWHVAASVGGGDLAVTFAAGAQGDPVKGSRLAYFPELGGRATATVYDRYRLVEGARIDGPALIEERESTIVIGPSGTAEVDGLGNVRIVLGDG